MRIKSLTHDTFDIIISSFMLSTVNFAKSFKKIAQPIFVSGDDEFLKYDINEIFVNYWRKQGYKYSSLKLNSSENWLELNNLITHNSLFDSNKVITCYLNQNSLSKKQDLMIANKIAKLNQNIKLMFISSRVSATLKKSNILPCFNLLAVWPLKPNELIAWGLNQAEALNLDISAQQMQTIIQKSDFCPLNIKNNLKILAINPKVNLALIVNNDMQKDNWQIIESALLGNTNAVIASLKDYNAKNYLSLHHVCFYTVEKLTQISDLISAGHTTDSAINKLINWPKQRQQYSLAINRLQSYNWHIIKQKAIEIDLAFKGSNTIWHAGKELEFLILMISDVKFHKFLL